MLNHYVHRFTTPIVAHWRGQNALLPTIMLAVLGISSLIWLIPIQSSFPLACTIILFSSTVLIWQIVGTWRAITFNLISREAPFLSWLGYGAILIAMTVTLFQAFDQTSGKFSKAAYLKNLLLPPELVSSDDGLSLFISGEIDFTTNTALLNTIAKNPTAKTVILASNGGLIYAARALANNIMANNLDTRVDSQCASACTIVFMAGKNRTMGNNAKLGFHRYKFEIINPLRKTGLNDEQSKDIAFFKKRGVSEEFLQQAFQATHTNLWFPDKNTLVSAGIITNN